MLRGISGKEGTADWQQQQQQHMTAKQALSMCVCWKKPASRWLLVPPTTKVASPKNRAALVLLLRMPTTFGLVEVCRRLWCYTMQHKRCRCCC